jgi:hypothetical protein
MHQLSILWDFGRRSKRLLLKYPESLPIELNFIALFTRFIVLLLCLYDCLVFGPWCLMGTSTRIY